MKKNMGKADRVVRLVFGLIALLAALFVTGLVLKLVLLFFGLFCLLEALVSRCALYAILGKNTCPIE